jgi:hypothetical protein
MPLAAGAMQCGSRMAADGKEIMRDPGHDSAIESIDVGFTSSG